MQACRPTIPPTSSAAMRAAAARSASRVAACGPKPSRMERRHVCFWHTQQARHVSLQRCNLCIPLRHGLLLLGQCRLDALRWEQRSSVH